MSALVQEEPVLVEASGRVLLITLNRPDAMNAIDTALAQSLLAAIARLELSDDLSVGVLTGAGRAFCAGMDLKAFRTEGPPKGLPEFLRDGSRKPLVAAIEGSAFGGGLELALTCDLIVAARDARLGLTEARVGLIAAGGGLLRVASRLPTSIALELALTAQPISVERAEAHGLVNRVAEPGTAVAVAQELAQQIARNAPLALAAGKQLIRGAKGLTEQEYWDLQRPLVSSVFRSADAREGADAFAQKRTPHWQGR